MPVSLGNSIPKRVAIRASQSWTRGPTGCYISTYSVASHGYSQIGWSANGRTYMTLAHRAAWTRVHGQIPAGMTIDHKPTCDRRCVNVRHLRLLSNYENGRRTRGRDWPMGECINGHPNSLLHSNKGGTRCSTCQRDAKQRYREHHQDRVRQSQAAYRERKRRKSAA
jgi:hypothetical protein